ncbi:vacuolar protein sorting-associated protein 26 domain-containing protein [Phthorimaea operculella]|nr:vacuolar protein sorting-associated protein 26 domain-containing protein [Phthorimaea operculella]
MGFDDGRILFQNENGIFHAGEVVRGKVVFDQQKNKNFRGMYAELKGVCDVCWTTKHSRKINDRTEHYTVEHTSHEIYVENKIYLIGGPSGHHEYPFEFMIPHECPQSFEGTYGHIRYIFKVVIERSFKADQEKEIEIKVVNLKDLNKDPYCKEPMEFEFEEGYCCWCTYQGKCKTTVKLPQSGYCPGQAINFELKCANNSRIKMDAIKFEIKETKKYVATHNSEEETKYEEKVIARLRKGPVPKNITRKWILDMEIPQIDVYNLDACRYIDIRYDFKIKITPSGLCQSNIKDSRRLVLGHITLREFENNPQGDQIVAQPIAPSMMQFPVANPPYPGTNPPYLGENPPYPAANMPYPGANPPYPAANPPYPGANPPYPGASPTYPAANPPYPGPNSFPAALPEVSPCPVGNDPIEPGFKINSASPPLPSVTPYPNIQQVVSLCPDAPSAPPPAPLGFASK